MLVSEEQKKDGLWGISYSCHISALFTAALTDTARHKLRVLAVMFSWLSDDDFLTNKTTATKSNDFFFFYSWTIPFLSIGFVMHVQSGSLLTGSRPWQWSSSGSPSKTVLSCSLDGVGLLRSRVYMDMMKPGVQYPHCVPCAAAMRSCTAVRTMLHALLQCAPVQQ